MRARGKCPGHQTVGRLSPSPPCRSCDKNATTHLVNAPCPRRPAPDPEIVGGLDQQTTRPGTHGPPLQQFFRNPVEGLTRLSPDVDED